MIVLRFKLSCRPGSADQLAAALAAVVAPSRELAGVVSFDIGRDLTDPSVFIATEVFDDEDARTRQEALPEVLRVMELLPEALAGPPELILYQAEPAAARAG